MALANLVRVTSATPGTGTLTLGSAVIGFLTPTQAGMVDGAVYSYAIEANYVASGDDMVPNSREVGTGILGGTGTTLTRSIINSTNSNALVSLSGDEQVIITGLAHDWLAAIAPGAYNAELAESHAASAATFALKTIAGNDPTPADPVIAIFSNGTKAILSAALSVTVPSTATMGARTNIPFRLWFCLINDGGTWRLGVRNCLTTVAGSGSGSAVTAINGFPDHGTLSSTVMNTSSDNAGVTYTDAAVTTQPFAVLGYADYDSTALTAGTWSASPNRIVAYGMGIPLPGMPTGNIAITQTGAGANGATTTPVDDTIPQIGEGNQFMSQTFTATSVQNVLKLEAQAVLTLAADAQPVSAIHQDATTSGSNNALVAASMYFDTATTCVGEAVLRYQMLAATLSQITFSYRAGAATGTTRFNQDSSGTRKFGGVMNSYLSISEFMG